MLDMNAFMHSPAQNVAFGANRTPEAEKDARPLVAADEKAKATGRYVPANWAAHVDTQIPLAHSNNDYSDLLIHSLILSLSLSHQFTHPQIYSSTNLFMN